MNEYKFADIEVGMKASFEKEITLEMEKAFRDISWDDNPLHRDDEFARGIGKGKFPQHAAEAVTGKVFNPWIFLTAVF